MMSMRGTQVIIFPLHLIRIPSWVCLVQVNTHSINITVQVPRNVWSFKIREWICFWTGWLNPKCCALMFSETNGFYKKDPTAFSLLQVLAVPMDMVLGGHCVTGHLSVWDSSCLSNAWRWKVKGKSLSRVRPSVTPWTTAFQAPPSMGFSRQDYWSGVPLPSPKRLLAILNYS